MTFDGAEREGGSFSDFVAERDALQGRVFPAIDAVCRAYGARFQAVDLRWGVSEEAGRYQQTLDLVREAPESFGAW